MVLDIVHGICSVEYVLLFFEVCGPVRVMPVITVEAKALFRRQPNRGNAPAQHTRVKSHVHVFTTNIAINVAERQGYQKEGLAYYKAIGVWWYCVIW